MIESKKVFGISVAHWLTAIPFFDTNERNQRWKDQIWREQYEKATEQIAEMMGVVPFDIGVEYIDKI
jgi:hypothetical protein